MKTRTIVAFVFFFLVGITTEYQISSFGKIMPPPPTIDGNVW